MKALILAGGLGTRLQPVLRDRPKPMAPVKGKPFLDCQIDQLRAYGLSDIVLYVGHLAYYIWNYFGNGRARLLGFEEKVESGPGWIKSGIYVLEPTILDFMPTSAVVSVEKEIFLQILERNLHLFGYPVQGFFVDIGTPRGYYRFCRHIEKQA